VRHPAQLTVLDDEAFHRLHEAVLDVLESVGVEMKHEGGRRLCADAGAAVSGTRVRPSPELVERALETAPRSWALTQRGEARTALTLSPEHSWFGTGPDCPYVRDPYSGARRRARLADVRSYAALTEKLPTIDFHMSMGLPEDVAPERVDIVQFAAMLASTGKPLVASSPFGGETLRVMHDMASACGGPDSFACLAMSSPPLMLDEVAVDKILTCAELHVPLVLAPSPSAGTTAPASLAAVLVLALAEVTAGLVVHQLAAPGAPFVFGSGCGVTNMRTSVEAYLPPGVALGNHVAAEMATRYGLPSWSYGGTSDSKVPDGQLGVEYGFATLLGLLSRATLLHDVGYLESGMQSSYEALVLGDDLSGFAREIAAGLLLDDTSLAIDEIKAVGPGGSHLARPMTRRSYRGFWHSQLLDQTRHDHWQTDGAATLEQRLRTRTQTLLAEPPAFSLREDAGAELARLLRSAGATDGEIETALHAPDGSQGPVTP
jgi:trimethylamine--corrinoid protein Co-methyltransferase